MSRDLRKYTSQTNIRLTIGAFILLFVVGLGLIAIIYGTGAALVGLLCLLGALIPIGLVALLMFGLDVFVKRLTKTENNCLTLVLNLATIMSRLLVV